MEKKRPEKRKIALPLKIRQLILKNLMRYVHSVDRKSIFFKCGPIPSKYIFLRGTNVYMRARPWALQVEYKKWDLERDRIRRYTQQQACTGLTDTL